LTLQERLVFGLQHQPKATINNRRTAPIPSFTGELLPSKEKQGLSQS
jgi:hypothetical protein